MTVREIYEVAGAGNVSTLALGFADFICRHAGSRDPRLFLAAALASRAVDDGHVCVDLNRLWAAGGGHFPAPAAADRDGDESRRSLVLPPLAGWLAFLREDTHCQLVIGEPGTDRPLVLDGVGRLYLHRYRDFEERLAAQLRALADAAPAGVSECAAPVPPELLRTLFPEPALGDAPRQNWPKVAAVAALRRRLTVIAGGPGTGKTSVVARLVALLAALRPSDAAPLQVCLAAPTGKASARLSDAFEQALAAPARRADGSPNPLHIAGSPAVRERVSAAASTIHRLLGSRPGTIHFRHGAGAPLAADLVVIDEASMVPLPMMCRIVDALPSTARLILLGDMHQLASVEPGYVLGDICDAAQPQAFSAEFRTAYERATGAQLAGAPDRAPLADCCVALTYSWRFPPDSTIDRVSRAVNSAADADAGLAAVVGIATAVPRRAPGILVPAGGAAPAQPTETEVTWKAVPTSLRTSKRLPAPLLTETLHQRYRDFLNATDPAAALAAFDAFRVLAVMRRGPHGVDELNRVIEETLSLQFAPDRPAALAALQHVHGVKRALPLRRDGFYDHQPILITENHYGLGLFNGDIGVVLTDSADGSALQAYFPAMAPGEPPRALLPALLPAHQTAFAMTVHKAQGSQFDDVLLVLPDADSPLVARELVYTGITRASRRVEVWLNEATFGGAVCRRTERDSGLADALTASG
jgi:exodeoxyribonuclease V alpha subunit